MYPSRSGNVESYKNYQRQLMISWGLSYAFSILSFLHINLYLMDKLQSLMEMKKVIRRLDACGKTAIIIVPNCVGARRSSELVIFVHHHIYYQTK